jgi:hypothetical protein
MNSLSVLQKADGAAREGTDRPNELNNQIQNTLAMKAWSVEFSTVYWICTTGNLRLPGANSATYHASEASQF